MNVAIIGFGKMGQGIAKQIASGMKLKLIVDPNVKDIKDLPSKVPAIGSVAKVKQDVLDSIDVFIEFTSPDSAKENIKQILKRKKGARIVTGTTGWDIKSIESEIKKSGAYLLHSANFSVGINAIAGILPCITKAFAETKEFEASMVEYHHKKKKDAPSGTAKVLAKIIEDNKMKCPIQSVRSGNYPGTHIISFDAGYETIEIKHEVRSRDVFCRGAILATFWLLKQKKPGTFSCAISKSRTSSKS